MTLRTTIIEGVCVLAVGTALGWGVNSARSRGLDLQRDYFPSTAPASSQSAVVAPGTGDANTESTVNTDTTASTDPAAPGGPSALEDPSAPADPTVDAELTVHQAQLVPHDAAAAAAHDAAHDTSGDTGSLGDPLVIVNGGDVDPGVHQRAVARLQSKGLRAIELDELQAFLADEMFGYGLFMLLDARRPDVFAESHLPGARHYDPYYPNDVDEVLLSELQGAMRVVVYCNGGDCEDSESAALQLLGAGVSPDVLQVYVGGFEQWTLKKLPLERPGSEDDDA